MPNELALGVVPHKAVISPEMAALILSFPHGSMTFATEDNIEELSRLSMNSSIAQVLPPSQISRA
jgi:hypothetical protein